MESLLVDAPWQSIGIHPWDVDPAAELPLASLREAASDPRVVAIGEIGLDALRGPALDLQQQWLIPQLRLAEEMHLPVVLHVVKTYDRILALRKLLSPAVPWIIHGFRGKPRLARQLTDAGLFISLGVHHNPLVPAAITPDRLFHESDAPPSTHL